MRNLAISDATADRLAEFVGRVHLLLATPVDYSPIRADHRSRLKLPSKLTMAGSCG